MAGSADSTAVTQAERAAVIAGVVTSVAGTLLVLAPGRYGRSIGMEDHPNVMRAIGVSDLMTAPGLLVARPRWPWLAARALLNVGLAAGALGYRDALGTRTAASGAALFAALTAVDGRAALTLRAAGR